MSLPSLTGAWLGRRRAWLLAACAGLAAVTYLVGWVAYAANGLTALGRLEQRPPGATAYAYGAEYRVLSLGRTDELRDSDDPADSEIAAAGTSWVVAEIEVVRRADVPDYYCAFELVGPDRRRWDPEPPSTISRELTSFCRAEELPIGRPGRLEVVFTVPNGFLDRIYGVAVPDVGSRRATPVLRPA